MARIAVVGSVNVDLTVRVPRLPVPGETLSGKRPVWGAGGKGANQAVMASRIGAEVFLIGAVGSDPWGEQSRKNLREQGLNLGHLRTLPDSTGMALIFVDDTAENCIVIVPGANAGLSVQQVREAADVIQSADLVLAQGETPCEATREAFALARAAGRKTLLNPAPFHKELLSLMPLTDLLIINEVEREAIRGSGVEDPLLAWSAGGSGNTASVPSVVLTMGKKGCSYRGPEGEIRQGPFAVEAVDPTAAGDAFIGTLAVGMANGEKWKDSLRKASAAAALTVTRWGAQQAFPTHEELDRFLATATEAQQ